MKKIFLLLLTISFCSIKICSQIPVKDGVFVYDGVVTVENTDKDALYGRIYEWFARTYNSANDVIQLNDKENGKIVGKGIFKIDYYQRKPTISHTISVYVKDGRFRYVIEFLKYSDIQGDSFNLENFPKGWVSKGSLYKKVDEKIKNIIGSLIDYSKKQSTIENEDW